MDIAAAVAATPTHTLRQHFPQWHGCYYNPAVWKGRSLHSLDAPSPPLRTNCGRPSRGYVARAADRPFVPSTPKVYPTIPELLHIMGWPRHAFLPGNKRSAGGVLGNSVCPPVARALASAPGRLTIER